MRLFPVRPLAFVALLLSAAAAHADDSKLAEMVPVSVTATSSLPGHAAERALAGGHKGDTWCGAGAKEGDSLSIVFPAPVTLEKVTVESANARALTVEADSAGGATIGDREIAYEPREPLTRITVKVEPGKKVCVGGIQLMRARASVVPVLGVDAAALAAVPDALKTAGAALDKCDNDTLAALFDFPFTYENAQRGASFKYKTVDELVKRCQAWRAKAGNVDLDTVTAPVPDSIYIRWHDITMFSDAPGRLNLAVSHVKREQVWRLAWRDGKWHVAAIDTEGK
jgi:hypothetical protein